jgi:O-antigen/teichoic acid export membrane protein
MARKPARLRAMLNNPRWRNALALDRLGGQTVAAFGLKGIGAVASFAISWLIARQFGAAGSGLFGIAVTTITFATMVLVCGLDTQLLRTVAGDLKQGHAAQAGAMVWAVARLLAILAPLAALALWLVHVPLARMLAQPELAPLLGIMVWAIVPLALVRIASVALRASGRMVSSQLVDGPLGTTIAALLLAGGLYLGGMLTLAIVGYLYVGALVIGAASGWIAYRRGIARHLPAAPLPPVWPLAIAGLPILLSGMANVFTEWFTTVSLGAHWPAAEVGHYRVAWQFVALAGLVQLAMEAVLGPRIAAAARVDDKREIASVARKGMILVLLLAAPLFIALLVFPERLLAIFGDEFASGALALRILAIGQLVRLAAGPLGTIIIMSGRERWVLAYAIAGVALCVLFCLLLIPAYGAIGAAIAASATVILRNLGALLIVQKVIGINLFARSAQ